MFLTYHYAKGKITAKTDYFKMDDNESSLTNEEKEDNYEKFNSERDKLKKRLYALKNESINSFSRIEDDYNGQYTEIMEYYKKITDNKVMNENGENLFKSNILEKNIFDQDLSNVTSSSKVRMNLLRTRTNWSTAEISNALIELNSS